MAKFSAESDRSWDAMEGILYSPPPAPGLSPASLWNFVRVAAPGLAIAVVVGLAAAWVSDNYGGPVMLFALLIGMAFHFLMDESACVPGIDLAARGILRLGVGLLGLRVTIDQVAELGLYSFAIVVVAVVATILFSLMVARLLRLDAEYGTLTGGAVAICGASAALAISSVLPHSRHLERNTIVTVIGVTTLSTVAMVLYPALVVSAGFPINTAGIFLGGTIHDVAQVVGAGYTISEQTGDTATIVKLLRVAMLVPVVLALSIYFWLQAQAKGQSGSRFRIPTLPWFLVMFVGLVLLNSGGLIPDAVTDAGSTVSRWCLLAAIAALGVKTSLGTLKEVGWRPVAILGLNTLFLAGAVAIGVYLFLPT